MKRFHFRLEQVLAVRKHVEREWELKLADITGKCLLLEYAIRRCEDNIRLSFDERRAGEGALDIDLFMQYELFMARMRQEIDEHRAALAVRQREREEIQKAYVEAARKRKVLEKLKERRAADYYRAARREEFNILDEVNTSALIRADYIR